MKSPNRAYDLRQEIAASAGARFLDRSHARSFSLNIFQMNALELMEASRRMRDPDQGFSLMLEKNREAGRQAHRELNRHVHNFAASALTLVEHTRIMMRENYANMEIQKAYEKQVTAIFGNEPVANFVQGLRNYMVHKGLPSSHMFLSFKSDPDAADGSGTQETGVRYDTASLLEWSRWKPPARKYLTDAGEHLDVHRFAEDYLVLVNRFHAWLDAALWAHHQDDLTQLAQLQQRLATNGQPPEIEQSANEAPPAIDEGPFEFPPDRVEQLNRAASDLLGKVRELVFKPSSPSFPTQRPIAANLTDIDMIGTPKYWGTDANGTSVFMFIRRGTKVFGFSEQDYQGVYSLADLVLVADWARDKLSRSFVEETFIGWAQARFEADGGTFVDALSASARIEVKPVEVWAPVAHLEVEEAFDFGPVRIAPITAEKIDSLKAMGSGIPAEHKQRVEEFMEVLRKEIQGCAAVVVPFNAEPKLAEERGRRIAQDAISLLRFLSPAAGVSSVFCPVALLGSEFVPTSKLLVLSDTGFSITDVVLDKNMAVWRLPSQQLASLKAEGLDQAASLISPDRLSEFGLAVRSSLIIYSTGVTLAQPMERLALTLSALENVLLKHEMEPVAANVAARVGFLIAKDRVGQEEAAQVVRQAYWMREQTRITALTHREEELLALLTFHAYGVLRTVLGNVRTFNSKVAFVGAVDNLAFAQA